ncbi:hypothetical protein LXL04_000178 [Taraxacum kok-saghyz]
MPGDSRFLITTDFFITSVETFTSTLMQHDQIVAGIDWSKSSNRIATVSHDRNSYVWNQEGSVWVPTLVILRLNRAALCVQWSPKCILQNMWVSKLIRKKHDSSVTSVAWHPDNAFNINTLDEIQRITVKDLAELGLIKLQQIRLWESDLNRVEITPAHFFDDFPSRVMFVSEKLVISVGYDCNPMVFARKVCYFCYLILLCDIVFRYKFCETIQCLEDGVEKMKIQCLEGGYVGNYH